MQVKSNKKGPIRELNIRKIDKVLLIKGLER